MGSIGLKTLRRWAHDGCSGFRLQLVLQIQVQKKCRRFTMEQFTGLSSGGVGILPSQTTAAESEAPALLNQVSEHDALNTKTPPSRSTGVLGGFDRSSRSSRSTLI